MLKNILLSIGIVVVLISFLILLYAIQASFEIEFPNLSQIDGGIHVPDVSEYIIQFKSSSGQDAIVSVSLILFLIGIILMEMGFKELLPLSFKKIRRKLIVYVSMYVGFICSLTGASFAVLFYEAIDNRLLAIYYGALIGGPALGIGLGLLGLSFAFALKKEGPVPGEKKIDQLLEEIQEEADDLDARKKRLIAKIDQLKSMIE